MIPKEPGKLFYKSFDEYVQDFPEAESLRAEWRDGELLVRGRGWHIYWPGRYFYARAFIRREDGPVVVINDSDDGLIEKYFGTLEEANAELESLCEFAPIAYQDLISDFGYSWW